MSPEHGYRSRDRDRRSRDRSRSPYSDRLPRGSKRAREEEYTDRSRSDPRRFKVHYEDAPQEYTHRSRISYEDIDRGPTTSSDLRYDDRDRYAEKRPRTRSRSPYRSDRGGDRHGRGGQSRRDDRYGRDTEDRKSNAYGNGDFSRERKDLLVSKRGPSVTCKIGFATFRLERFRAQTTLATFGSRHQRCITPEELLAQTPSPLYSNR